MIDKKSSTDNKNIPRGGANIVMSWEKVFSPMMTTLIHNYSILIWNYWSTVQCPDYSAMINDYIVNVIGNPPISNKYS